jgi:hypothetical protein
MHFCEYADSRVQGKNMKFCCQILYELVGIGLEELSSAMAQGYLKVFSVLVMQWRNAAQRQDPLDGVSQLPEPLAD